MMEIEQKFRLGQEVTVVRASGGAVEGERVVISRIDSEEPMYRVLVGAGYNVWLNTDDLTESSPLKYKVGDKVYTVDDSLMPAGTLGHVVTVDVNDRILPYRVSFEGRHMPRWVAEEDITDEAPTSPLKYKVGDTVYANEDRFGYVETGTPGRVVDVDKSDYDLPYLVKFDGYDMERWASEDDITDEAPTPPLKYGVGDTVYATKPVYIALSGSTYTETGSKGTVIEIDDPISALQYRVNFEGYGKTWCAEYDITDEAPEPEYLPVGTEVMVRGYIDRVDKNDENLPYHITFAGGFGLWLPADTVQPVNDDTNTHPANGVPVGQYGYSVAMNESDYGREFSYGDPVVVVNKSLGVAAGTVGTFIAYDEDGECIIQVGLGGQYFIKNRDLAHAYPVTQDTNRGSCVIATEDVRIPGTDIIVTKGSHGELESSNDSYFVVRWDCYPATWFMNYQDSYVVYE